MRVRLAAARIPPAFFALMAVLAVLASGCGHGDTHPTAGGPYGALTPAASGAIRVDLLFPGPSQKLTSTFADTRTAVVHVLDRATREPVMPPMTGVRRPGAASMSIEVPNVPPGDYRVLVHCIDSQGGNAGHKAPKTEVLPRETAVVTISGTAEVARISVTPSAAAVLIGGTEPFAATAILTDGTSLDVTSAATWTSTQPGTATIDAQGVATGVGAGETDIKATMGGLSDTAHLSVGLTSLAVAPPLATVMVGETVNYTATATFANGATRDVTDDVDWSTDNTSKAAVEKGTVIGLGDGTTTVVARLEGQSASAQLNVVTVPTVTGITVTPPTAALSIGASQPLTAVATYSDGTTADVTQNATWTSASPNIVDVSVAGVVLGVSAGGPVNVTATYAGQVATAQVSVNGPATVVSVTLTPTAASVAVGASQTFTATATWSDTSVQDVTRFATWTSANSGVATVNDQGQVLGVASGGPVLISASFGGQTGGANVTVTGTPTLQSITVTPATARVYPKEHQGFTATATYSDASTSDITTQAAWSSSNPGAAPVDELGVAEGLTPGTTTITATLGAVSGNATLTVVTPALVSLAVTPSSATREVGTAQDFLATVTLSDGSTEDVTLQVTWASSDPSVAVIDTLGSALGLMAGSTSISATLGALAVFATLTVKDPPPPSPPPPVTAALVIADTANSRVVQVGSDGSDWKSVGELGQQGANFRFNQPRSAVYGRHNGNAVVYVADQRNDQIVRFTAFRPGQWTTMGETGTGVNQYNRPTSVDSFIGNSENEGAVVVADFGNRRLAQFQDAKALGQNQRISDWKTFSTGVSGPLVARVEPFSDRIYYADSSNRIVRIDGISGSNPVSFGSGGSGQNQFSMPVDIRFDRKGRIYVADSGNHRIVRFDDLIGTNWTTFGTLGSGVNQLRQPSGLEILDDGRIVIHDTGNSRIVTIRDMDGTGWSTFGTQGAGVNQFNQPDAFVGN